MAYLDSQKIVGARVDIVAHSMGGLAARNYAAQVWYGLPPEPAPSIWATRIKSYRNRGQGQFHTVITLDTPHQGSKLASSLIDHRACIVRTDWATGGFGYCGSGVIPIPTQITVAGCLQKMGMPVSGGAYSLIPPDDQRGTAIKNLFGPNIPGADWRAIGAVKPGNGVLGTALNLLIKSVIPGTAPPCDRFRTGQTVDGILETPYYNDAVVTLSSQLGGRVVVDSSHRWFRNLSHALVVSSLGEWLTNRITRLTFASVPGSPDVWRQVCLWLSSNGLCPAPSSKGAVASGTGTQNALPVAISPVEGQTVQQVDELPVARIPLIEPGTPNGVRNPTLGLQPWGLRAGARDYLPANTVQFSTDPPSGSSVIKLDANGIVHLVNVGTATVKAKYFDIASSTQLTSQVQINVVSPQQ